MIYTYSTLDGAIDAIPEFCKENEQDVFIVKINYPYGNEFHLRKRDEIFSEESENIIHKYYLPFDHEFMCRDNALRECAVWSLRLNKRIILDRHYKYKNGYRILNHYTLKICST